MELRFSKMHGLGNDFVVVDAIRQRIAPDPGLMRQIADAFVAAAKSDGFLEMLDSKFFISDVKIGEEADREGALMESITTEIFNKFQDQIGADVTTAEELGLPAPADFDTWWPPEGYVAPPISSSS